jgi:hypothetical protein
VGRLDNKTTIYLFGLIDLIILFIAFSNWIFLSGMDCHRSSSSFLIIFSSLFLLFKSKDSRNLLLLFSMYAYINISFVFSDILGIGMNLGSNTLLWQDEIRSSRYVSILINAIVMFTASLSFLLPISFFKKSADVSVLSIQKKDNYLIFYTLYFISIFFWFNGYGESRGSTYESVTKPIYEYCLVIFPLMWFYSGRGLINKLLLLFYVIIYVVQALKMGDRSSAIPMLILVFLLSPFKLNLIRVTAIIFSGLIFSNLISIYRLDFDGGDVFEKIYYLLSNRSFTSDTVSQSFYTAITIFAASEQYEMPMKYFGNFILGIFLGGSTPDADVINLSGEFYFNRAGGFYFSWFYFWFGFFGIFISAFILAFVISYCSKSKSDFARLYQIVIIVFFIRWYVYTPFVFFRSVLFVFGVLVIIAVFVEYLYKSYFRLQKLFDN